MLQKRSFLVTRFDERVEVDALLEALRLVEAVEELGDDERVTRGRGIAGEEIAHALVVPAKEQKRASVNTGEIASRSQERGVDARCYSGKERVIARRRC